MGYNIGADTALVLTGISTVDDVDRSSVKPKYVVNSLLDLL
jgi:4-nitrophenyl phosphatase